LAQQNAQQTWQKSYWNEFQQVNKGQILSEISNFLSVPLPHYFECLDISNLYTEDIVAGFLVFVNGEKNLARSKLYKLNNADQESDIARVKQACLTHYKKYSQEVMPKLVVVDGAKEQVKAVQKALKELGLETLVIGLAKDESHRTSKIITSDLKELEFGDKEKIKNFFTNCQEEVHRYAINFHRRIHRRSTLKQQ
jgi:excinuclease ABC subunit C